MTNSSQLKSKCSTYFRANYKVELAASNPEYFNK